MTLDSSCIPLFHWPFFPATPRILGYIYPYSSQGHFDAPLNKTGRYQAKLAGRALSDIRFDAAFTSDSSRAKVTAEAIMDEQTVWIGSEKTAVLAEHVELRERVSDTSHMSFFPPSIPPEVIANLILNTCPSIRTWENSPTPKDQSQDLCLRVSSRQPCS